MHMSKRPSSHLIHHVSASACLPKFLSPPEPGLDEPLDHLAASELEAEGRSSVVAYQMKIGLAVCRDESQLRHRMPGNHLLLVRDCW